MSERKAGDPNSPGRGPVPPAADKSAPVPASEPGRATVGKMRAECVRAIMAAWEKDYSANTSSLAISAAEACVSVFTVAPPAPMPGMETTAEERADAADFTARFTDAGGMVSLVGERVAALLRDLDRALAEIARLNAALAEADKRSLALAEAAARAEERETCARFVDNIDWAKQATLTDVAAAIRAGRKT